MNVDLKSPVTPQLAKRRLTPFQSAARRFTPENAIFLSAAAIGAYKKSEDEWNEQLFPAHGFTNINYSAPNKKSAEFLLLESRYALIVAFKGTKEVRDWITNIVTRFRETSPGRFHYGFWDSLGSVWKKRDKLSATIEHAHRSGKHIWLTGHSLGGALAVLAGVRCHQQGIPIKSVHTFGQPLVTTKDFPTRYPTLNERIVRFQAARDLVPLIPPRGLVKPRTNFRKGRNRTGHYESYYPGIGTMIYLDASGDCIPGAPERSPEKAFKKDWKQSILAKLTHTVPYHAMDRYHHCAFKNRRKLNDLQIGPW
ncbi:MAG: lipase family protein [Verrucomicrobiota bacterium]